MHSIYTDFANRNVDTRDKHNWSDRIDVQSEIQTEKPDPEKPKKKKTKPKVEPSMHCNVY